MSFVSMIIAVVGLDFSKDEAVTPVGNEWHCPRCGRVVGDFAKKCWSCGYEKRVQGLKIPDEWILMHTRC